MSQCPAYLHFSKLNNCCRKNKNDEQNILLFMSKKPTKIQSTHTYYSHHSKRTLTKQGKKSPNESKIHN